MSSSPPAFTPQLDKSTAKPSQQIPAFDLFVVGTGGGPDETNLSGYLLKAHEQMWSDGIVGVEAGSGLGALKRILANKQANPFASVANVSGPSAAEIYSYIRTYLISHAHLDHVLSLVLLAGSFGGPRKSIRGSRDCLEDLQSIFKPSRIWPNLASWNPEDADHLYLYDPILPIGESPSKKKKGPTQDESENEENSTYYTPLHGPLTVCMFPISHGPSYDSSAFFIRHTSLGREFLFFGDVEYDLSSINPRISNVWSAAAPKFVSGELSAVFIECSWPSGRPNEKMFGHLTPEHLVAELQVLANFVSEHRNLSNNYPASTNPRVTSISPRRRSSSSASPERKRLKQSVDEDPSEGGRRPVLQNALSGLRVYIIHCKEELTRQDNTQPINQVISNQVRELVNKLELGAEIVAAEQGSLIHI